MAVLNRPAPSLMFGMPQLGVALGLKSKPRWGIETDADINYALIAACSDLEQVNLIEVGDGWINVMPTVNSRPYRTASPRQLWPVLGEGHLDPDEDTFLRILVTRSQVEHEDWAEAQWVTSSALFADLGWEWDEYRSRVIIHVLEEQYFVDTQMTVGKHEVRPRLADFVRVSDEVGPALFEAREHVHQRHLRAAGCIAGVELERALKHLCTAKQAPFVARLPTISDYNDALKGKGVYARTTWRKIQHLGDLRNKCAHVLDDDPTESEIKELLDGVDAVLRSISLDTEPSR